MNKNVTLKAKAKYINTYEQAYDMLKNTPLFDINDWDYSVNKSEQDLSSYIDFISQYNKLPTMDILNSKYRWQEMDTDDRTLLMYNELYADKVNKKDRDIIVGYDTDGKELKEKRSMTDYEYTDYLLEQQAKYRKEQQALYEKELSKQENWMWTSLMSVGATAVELAAGLTETVENVVNLLDAGSIAFTHLVYGLDYAEQTFIERLNDGYMLPNMKIDTRDLFEELYAWEADNTFYVNSQSGERTTTGKLLGDVAHSLGNMAASIGVSFLIPGAGTPSFYASTFENKVQERIDDYGEENIKSVFDTDSNSNSIATELLIGEAALETGTEYLIEWGLGKLLGTTWQDAVRGVSTAGKTSTGFKRYLEDTLQEGIEETFQEFATWSISNVTGLVNDKYYSELTTETLMDAFAMGAFSAIITGGIAITTEAYSNEQLSKALVADDETYKLLEEEKDKESKNQKTYRRNLLTIAQASLKLQNISDAFGLNGVLNAYDKAVKMFNPNTKQGTEAITQLTMQMYVAYKSIMDMYGTLGETRAKNAEKLLNDLKAYSTSNYNVLNIRHATNISKSLLEQARNIGVDSVIEDAKLKALEEATKKLEESKKVPPKKKRGRPKKNANKVDYKQTDKKDTIDITDDLTKLQALYDSSNEMFVGPESVNDNEVLNKRAYELAKLYEQDLVLWDNHEIVQQDNHIFAPIDAILNLSAGEIMKSAAERTIAVEFTTKLPENVLNYFVAEYRNLTGKLLDSTADINEQVIYNLLYNKSFYNYLLYRGNIDTFNILKVLDSLIVEIAERDKDDSIVNQYYEIAKRVRMTMGPALAMYFCNNQAASLENVTVFTDAQLKFILDRRSNSTITAVLLNKDTDNPNYDNYLKAFYNRVNGLDIDSATKLKYNADITNDDIIVRSRAIGSINSAYNDILYNKFDNKYYFKDNTVTNCIFNAFIDEFNTPLEMIENGLYPPSLEIYLNGLSIGQIQDWYKLQFELFTNNQYTFEINAYNKLTVKELETYKLDKLEHRYMLNSKISADSMSNRRYMDTYNINIVKDIKSNLQPFLKISNFDLTYTTIENIVDNPRKYLKDESLKDINSKYNIVNKNTVFMYLRDKLLLGTDGKVSIVLDSNGNYVPAIFTDYTDFINNDILSKMKYDDKSFTILNDIFSKQFPVKYKNKTYTFDDFINADAFTKIDILGTISFEVPITKFIRKDKLAGDLKNTKIIFENLFTPILAKHSPSNNTITINTFYYSNFYDLSFLSTLVHELQHAQQDVYNLTAGGDASSITVTDEMISDFKKHIPYLNTIKDDNIVKEIQQLIYTTLGGEQLSRGTYNDYLYVVPMRIKNNYLYTPWGKVYTLSGKNIPRTFNEESNITVFTFEQAVKYKEKIQKAIDIARDKTSENQKLYKKDFKHLHLPDKVVEKFLNNTYLKKNDVYYDNALKAIRDGKALQARKQHKQHKLNATASANSTRIFIKNAKGTNLMYWVNKSPDLIPYLNPAVQDFVLAAEDLSKLPADLSNKIKNATLTIRDINNFVRDNWDDTDSIDDYVFNALKKSVFKNTIFKSMSEVKDFVNKSIVEQAWAIKAVLLNLGKDDALNILYKKSNISDANTLSNIFKQFRDGSFIKNEDTKNKLKKVYTDTINKFSTFYEQINDGKGGIKFVKRDINMEDALSDVALGLLYYYDGSIDTLAYIAGNAKNALKRSVIVGQPFTYDQKQDIGQHTKQTVSLDAQLQGKKGEASKHSIAETVADERSYIEDDSEQEIRSAIMAHIKNYVLEIYKSKNVNFSKLNSLYIETDTGSFKQIGENNLLQSLQKIANKLSKLARSWDEDTATDVLARLNTRDITGLTFEECVGLENVELVNSIFTGDDTTTIVERDEGRMRVDKKVRKNIYRLKEVLTKQNYKWLPDEYKKYFVYTKEGFTYDFSSLKDLTIEQLNSLNEDIKHIRSEVRRGDYNSKTAKNKLESVLKQNERLRKQNDKLKQKLKNKTDKLKNKTKKGSKIHLTEDVTINSDKPIPAMLKKLVDVTFYGTTTSTKKFANIANEKLIRVSMKEFFSQNSETLNNMTFKDAMEILDYFETSYPPSKEYTPYDTFRLYILGYFVEQLNYNYWQDTDYFRDRVEKMSDAIVRNGARIMSAARAILPMIKPHVVIQQSLLQLYDVELTDEEVEPLVKAIRSLNNSAVVKSTNPQHFKATVDKLNQHVRNIQEIVLEKYGKKDGKRKFNTWYDKALKFQKAAMLSSPATMVRNKFSNWILGGFDIKLKNKTVHLPGLNDISDVVGKIFTSGVNKIIKVRETSTIQYDFTKVKVTTETAEFIKKWLIDTGLLDLVSDGLSKYDERTMSVKTKGLEGQLTQMIVKGIGSRVLNQHTYGKGKFTTWLEKRTGKQFEHGVLDNFVNLIFKGQSDTSDIQRTALKYIGKMLQQGKIVTDKNGKESFEIIDLSKGVTQDVMDIIADAYTKASWDYMHRANFMSDFMNNMRAKHPKAHFVLNLVQPFMSSSWNWFVEALQYNPVTMIANIKKLYKLEQVVNSMDERARRGDYTVPDSRFAKMIVQRNIGKGLVGTGLVLLGFMLRSLGALSIDREDDKIKLVVADTYIDFSNLTGTSAILVGAQLANPDEGNAWQILINAFNQQFEDSALTSLMNTFRYDSTPYDYLTSLPTTIVAGFIPNIWKSVVRATNNHSIKYSPDVLGNLEYLAIQTIPWIEHIMPKSINPYTGEWEEKYAIPYIHQLINTISPISFKTYATDDVEKAFISVGLRKSMLTGKYNDLEKLGISQLDVNVLNEYYGKLNNVTVTDFINNKVKYDVEDDKGKLVSLYYKSMTTKQRKSVLNRITTQNANYSKIYTWTESGHKYYCNAEERKRLLSAGITKNIYIGNKGFVK